MLRERSVKFKTCESAYIQDTVGVASWHCVAMWVGVT